MAKNDHQVLIRLTVLRILHRQVLTSAVDKVFLEASTHKDLEYLSFDDYRAVRSSWLRRQLRRGLRVA